MREAMSGVVTLLARLALSLFFMAVAYDKFTFLNTTATALGAHGIPGGVPMVLVLTIVLALSALTVLTGLYTRLGAVVLIALLVLTTLTYAPFWAPPGQVSNASTEFPQFAANVAMIGGLLLLLLHGPGPLRLRLPKRKTAPAVLDAEATTATKAAPPKTGTANTTH